MRKLLVIMALLVFGAFGAWVWAGRAEGPVIVITEPSIVGQNGMLSLSVDTPDAELTRLEVTLEQEGSVIPLFSLSDDGARGSEDGARGSEDGASLSEDGTAASSAAAAVLLREGDRVVLTRGLGKRQIPELKAGAARILVTAARPVLFGYREAEASAAHDLQVNLTPPRVSVQSLHHFINHGGSEMVVFRATPAEAEAGVRVGDIEYPGYPASGAGVETSDAALRVAFFSLQWNQSVDTPINLFARDAYGNETTSVFDYQVFPKSFRNSRIQLDDRFLARVVPAILANSTELEVEDPSDLLASYLRINRDLRRQNNETISALARDTSAEILWRGPFKQLINTAVEAGFADQRAYIYADEEVDHQVHLGFDLASVAAAPVLAANRGRVLHAGWLGIYGNCVILDHGMGLQSLYAHLSSVDVAAGDMVDIDQRLGRSGATGLAGGDHLHFTMLLGGYAVTPIDWWSSQWVEDRISRKLREAGAPIG